MIGPNDYLTIPAILAPLVQAAGCGLVGYLLARRTAEQTGQLGPISVIVRRGLILSALVFLLAREIRWNLHTQWLYFFTPYDKRPEVSVYTASVPVQFLLIRLLSASGVLSYMFCWGAYSLVKLVKKKRVLNTKSKVWIAGLLSAAMILTSISFVLAAPIPEEKQEGMTAIVSYPDSMSVKQVAKIQETVQAFAYDEGGNIVPLDCSVTIFD